MFDPALYRFPASRAAAADLGPVRLRWMRWRAALTFAGPAFLVSVGYMDPGNWGADLAAGSRFGYRLLWVLVAANIVALFLQYLALKVGAVTGRDLAALVGERFGATGRRAYAVLAIVAMLATETAEFLGVAVGLRLLGLPLPLAIVTGAVLVVALVRLGNRRTRPLERAVFALLLVIAGVFVLQLALQPPGSAAVAGLVPGGLDADALPVALAMIGAVVMPHNLFLHSGLIQSRRQEREVRSVVRAATKESVVALNLALLVNAAILAVAAAALGGSTAGEQGLAAAHSALEPTVGPFAAVAFAVGLLAAGLASCVTGGLATQYVLDGLVPRAARLPLMARRLATMVPAVLALAIGVPEIDALVLSQVVLCVALPAVVVPLVRFAADPRLMGEHTIGPRTRRLAYGVALGLSTLNGWLLVQVVTG